MRILSAITLLLISINAIADECESIITLSKTVETVVQDKSSIESAANTFCNEYFQAKSTGKAMQASASYKLLSASYGSSQASNEEVASKYCSTSGNFNKREDAYKQYVETISPNAYKAYEQCLIMSKNDIKFLLDNASLLPKEFSMTVGFKPNSAGSSAILAITSSNDVTCKWEQTPEGKTFTFSATGSADIVCNRDDQTQRSFVKVTRTNGGEKLTFSWPRYDNEGHPVDSLLVLQNQNKDLAQKVSSLEGGIKSSVLAFNTENCPDGWLEYTPAYGRFVRGIDRSEQNIDSDGKRPLGNLQEDTIKQHIHNLPNNNIRPSSSKDGGHSPWIAGMGDGKTGGMVEGHSNETRPKNVALLYCEKQ